MRFLYALARALTFWERFPRNAALILFLFFVFFIVGAILVALGFDLDDFDAWLDRQGGWLDVIGSIVMAGLFALGGLAGLGIAAAGAFGSSKRRDPQGGVTIGGRIGALLGGALLAWFGLFGAWVMLPG